MVAVNMKISFVCIEGAYASSSGSMPRLCCQVVREAG